MEAIVKDYISHELVSQPELLPLKNDTPLLESGVLDSLSLLKLVLFLEQQFGVVIAPEDLIPENFETVIAICGYLCTLQQMRRTEV